MASNVLLCTIIMLISSTVTGFYSQSISARDNPEGVEQPALDLLNRERRLVGDCCVTGICIFVKTTADDLNLAGTEDPYCIEFQAKGKTYKHTLVNIPGPGESTLWELDLNQHFGVPNNICIEVEDITNLVIYNSKKDGTDGWQIDSISTTAKTVTVATGQKPLSVDMQINQWIDNDGDPTVQPGVVKKFELNLLHANNSTSCD